MMGPSVVTKCIKCPAFTVSKVGMYESDIFLRLCNWVDTEVELYTVTELHAKMFKISAGYEVDIIKRLKQKLQEYYGDCFLQNMKVEIIGPTKHPKGPQRTPKDTPKDPKGHPKGPQRTPKDPERTPKGPSKDPKGPQRALKGPQGPQRTTKDHKGPPKGPQRNQLDQ